jgi:thymidylate kinase
MNAPILQLSRSLLDNLHAQSITYCHWKNNHCLEKSLAGEDDLDLLVSEGDYDRFRSVISELGFKEACNRHIQFPGLFHFFGLDPSSGKLLHLHVHIRLVTGESHIKNYHLPLESMVLQNTRRHASGCRVPQAEPGYILFVLRYFIKAASLPGAYLLWKRRQYVKDEFDHCYVDDGNRIDSMLQRYFPYVDPSFFHSMSAALKEESSFWKRAWLGLQLKRKIKPLRRMSAFQTLRARYLQVAYRALNKALMKEKKSLVRGGAIIAVTGLDASGKSTVNHELQQWLKSVLNVRRYHVGRPAPVMVTLPFRALIRARQVFGSKPQRDPAAHSHTRNTMFALRYLVLAYERLRLLRSADKFRAKGYFVLCDRYPSVNFDVMDSPRIGQVPGKYLYNLFGKWERKLYEAMPIPDGVYNLKIPFELALERNRARMKGHKETDAQMRKRYTKYSDLQYRAGHYEVIDASRELPILLKDMRSKIWARI